MVAGIAADRAEALLCVLVVAFLTAYRTHAVLPSVSALVSAVYTHAIVPGVDAHSVTIGALAAFPGMSAGYGAYFADLVNPEVSTLLAAY